MTLKPGSQFGPYRITAPLGAGGMGEVYRATDTKLQRDVAIKVLPDDFARDDDRVARFEREAKVLASLSHPNIGHVYGLEEADGVRALILELVEGPTLAERIAQGPLTLEEALAIARQIAEALEAAHERGIVHRDLKPANVKAATDGRVKVLDFGLAKPLPPESPDRDPSLSPTLTAATQIGTVLGTAAYMAPEQARGRPVDRRADVWAFGVVLYEMLCGRRPFDGRDVSETLARVIEREPDWTALPDDLPPVLHAFLRRCLAKDPAQRIHHVADIRLALQGAFDADLPRQIGSARPRRNSRQALVVVGMLLAATAGATLVWLTRPDAGHRGVVRFALPAPDGTLLDLSWDAQDLALSPDGRQLAFVAWAGDAQQLWLRRLDGSDAVLLVDSDVHSPFWSPDGQWLAYFTAAQLRKLRPGSGPSEAVCPAGGTNSGAWGPADTILFTQLFSERDGLYRVSARGGEPHLLIASEYPAPQEPRWPAFLPGSDRFVYTAFKSRDEGDGADLFLYSGSLSSGTDRLLFRIDSRVAFTAGRMVLVEDGTLLARPWDSRRLRFTGDAVPLATGIPQAPTGAVPFAISEGGVLAYGTQSQVVRLAWWDRSCREVAPVGELAMYGPARLSPDGSKLALVSGDLTRTDIWIQDLERDVRTRFTSEVGLNDNPAWSPDGDRLVYSRSGPEVSNNGLFLRALTGGDPIRLDTPRGLLWTSDWSRDGRWIVYTEFGTTDTGSTDVWLLPMTEGGEPIPRLRSRFNERGGRVSPDGRWLAYVSDESGRDEVYVAPVTGSDRGTQVSTDGGSSSHWRGDGGELFYASGAGIHGVPITVRDGKLRPGRPNEVCSFAASADQGLSGVKADGQRFLVAEATDPGLTVQMVLNWMDLATQPR